MKTIEQILTEQRSIIETADTEGRNLTDDEVTAYEALETELKSAQKSNEIRARQTAYEAPNASVAAAVNVGVPRADDGLNAAFRSFLRTGQPNADIAELRAQGSATDSAGGYLVPPGFREKLVEVQKAFGNLAAEVENLSTATGNEIDYPTDDDTANSGTITAESAAFSNGADVTFGNVHLKAYKYTASGANNLPLRVPVELIQDSFIDIDAYLARKFGTRIARKQASDWATGTGTTMPVGICNSGLTADQHLTTTTTITYDDLLDLEAKLDPAYEQNAKWVFNKATWTAIRKLVDDNGRPLIQEQAMSGIGGAPQKTLLGYPVVLDQSFPNATGDSANFAVLGDLQEAYVIRRVAPLTVSVNPWTRASYGEIEYVAWERADGNIQNRKAFVVLATQDVA